MPADERSPATSALEALTFGDVEVKGRLPWSSNATLLATVCHQGAELAAVYKPGRGERPLWDFPDGLFTREVAAYALSEALGWGIVPETVLRHDLPLGLGSLQRFIAADFECHYFTLLEDERHHDALRRIAVFDLLANSADRKSGHCLLDGDGRIWAIDNGLTFHAQPKLRTVIWDFAGEPIPGPLLSDVARVAAEPVPALEALLHPVEVRAVTERAAAVVRLGVFPDPGTARRAYPWPLV